MTFTDGIYLYNKIVLADHDISSVKTVFLDGKEIPQLEQRVYEIALSVVSVEFNPREAQTLANDIAKEVLLRLHAGSGVGSLESLVKHVALNLINARIDLIQNQSKVHTADAPLDELLNLSVDDKTENRYQELAELFGEDGRETLELLVQGYSASECAKLLRTKKTRVEYVIKRAKRRYLKNVLRSV